MKDVSELLADHKRTDLTGNRLWVDRVKPCPGFVADSISFITYKNVEAAYLLKFDFYVDDVQVVPKMTAFKWTPCAICAEYTLGNLKISEKKYIGQDDTAVSALKIMNSGDRGITLAYRANTLLTELKKQARALYNPCFISYDNRNSDVIGFRIHLDCFARNVLRQNVYAQFRYHVPDATTASENDSLCGSIFIGPGETKPLTALFSCNIDDDSTDRVNKLKVLSHSEGLAERNDIAFQGWYERNVPELTCSDSLLEKLYYYRWYVVYKNIITPGVDCFQQECIYEGKDQFAQICTGSAAMQMRDARWMKHGKLALSQLNTLIKSQIQDGIDAGRFRDMYLNDIPFTAWETARIMGREDVFSDVFEPLKRFVDWETSELFVNDESFLPIVTGSWRTAAEYQPSFFEFTNPPWDHTQSNPFGNEHKTAVHRVEEAVYTYQNLYAIAEMAKAIGAGDLSDQYARRANVVIQNIIRFMWDEPTKFFYDLHPDDRRKALQSKNFAGFLPARCGIADEYGDEMFAHLMVEFDVPYPIPTAATDSPAFTPDNTWRVGPNASNEAPFHYDCCWNGPTWNFANSLVLDALGSYIQRSGSQLLNGTFVHLFQKWCEEQNPNENAIPNSCEHYNPYTGKPLRDVKDYFHSSFIDIVIKYVVGIMDVNGDSVVLNPLDIGVKKLFLKGIPIKGNSLDFLWDATEDPRNLIIRINGKTAYSGATQNKITIDLKGMDNE